MQTFTPTFSPNKYDPEPTFQYNYDNASKEIYIQPLTIQFHHHEIGVGPPCRPALPTRKNCRGVGPSFSRTRVVQEHTVWLVR